MNLPWLESVRPNGKAAQFQARVGAHTRELERFFLRLHAPAPCAEGFWAGDLLAVTCGPDAEPGDLVVWSTGSTASLALARIGADLALAPVGGFPAPPDPALAEARVRGVVVGRLRATRKVV